MTSAVEEIAAERRRQVEAEGYAPEHDDGQEIRGLAQAASSYLVGHSLSCP